jgi:dihydrofolate reductase
MRKIIVSEFVTLDGVMEDPGGAEGTAHGGWSFKFGRGDDQQKFKFDELFASDALLLGRVTYQGFAAAWPTMPGTGEFGERMNSLPKHVVSTTLAAVEWNNSRLIKQNVTEEISRLKQQPGQDIIVFGSGNLIQTLMAHDLVDQYNLLVHPVVLGSGKRLFREGSQATLKLVDTKTFGSGVTALIYQADRN